MAGKVLHEDFACFFEVRTVHAQPQEPGAECVLFILIVDILCLNALLADGLLVHQDGKMTECGQMVIIGCGRESCEGDLLIRDHQSFHCSSTLGFITLKGLDEVCHRVGAAVIPERFDQVFFHMEVATCCLADESTPAVDEVDQIAKAYTVVLTGRKSQFQIQRNFIRLVFCFLLFFALLLTCVQLILFCGILIFRFLLIQNFRLYTGRLFFFGILGHKLIIRIRRQFCVLWLVVRAFDVITAADQPLIQQGSQQISIRFLRFNQKISIPVDGVIANLISVQRRSGIDWVDTSQILHSVCEGLALGYIQFKFQHHSLLLS